jgi:hypothetical protein
MTSLQTYSYFLRILCLIKSAFHYGRLSLEHSVNTGEMTGGGCVTVRGRRSMSLLSATAVACTVLCCVRGSSEEIWKLD